MPYNTDLAIWQRLFSQLPITAQVNVCDGLVSIKGKNRALFSTHRDAIETLTNAGFRLVFENNTTSEAIFIAHP